MTLTETYCTECENVVTSTPSYCPDCGTEEPWDERPQYEFDKEKLPFVFSYEVYNDGYGLWRAFCSDYFGAYELTGDQIADLPEGLPKMKYCVHDLHFKLTEDLELEGPFMSKKEAREA